MRRPEKASARDPAQVHCVRGPAGPAARQAHVHVSWVRAGFRGAIREGLEVTRVTFTDMLTGMLQSLFFLWLFWMVTK